ncbi:MAG: CcoQ/FixQ family Cbb3-type cytochrome c oxidase assembly chaperone [Rhodobacterales bacterium]|nr:MAG: CcoQ/FixQ family Cbb3-type cytochrome c oxidase assembly chaperone [Rhodobacterales bacterium]
MDTYSAFREFADSWGMLAIFGVFIFAIFWAFRPGSRELHDDAANVPFRHEDRPAPDTDTTDPEEGQK